MAQFIVMARREWGKKCLPLLEVKGSEQRAIEVAQEIYKRDTMNRAVVLDARFRVVFKLDHRCRCTNCQYELDGKLRCTECNRLINTKPRVYL